MTETKYLGEVKVEVGDGVIAFEKGNLKLDLKRSGMNLVFSRSGVRIASCDATEAIDLVINELNLSKKERRNIARLLYGPNTWSC